MQKRIFTSESVTEGHPDKVCDQISDGVLDAILAQDPKARVACECCATTGMVMVMGEISTECYVDIPHVARDTICRIGYDKPESGFNGHTCAVLTAIDEQSGDIAMGVNSSFDDADTLGAGDQGMMFGFACSETPELMPAPITYAQQLAMKLSAVRKSGELDWLRPDGKSQVSVQYGEDGSVERIDTVVVSTQHADSVSIKDLREAVIERVIRPTLPARLIDGDTKFYVNPTGRFVVGGPAADSGLTGRKIIVDTYGGYAGPRRRRLLRQGSDEGRPQRCLYGPLRRQEPCRGRSCRQAARSSWPMPSALPIPSLSLSTPSERASACPTPA